MAVFTTDVVKHGGRKLMIWAILLVVGCIQYAYAVKPTNVKIKHTSGAAQVDSTRTYYAASGTPVVLTCSADGTVDKYLFKRFGVAIKGGTRGADGWDAADALTVTLNGKDEAGMYTCTARDASSEVADDDAEPLILTFGCTKPASGSPDPCVDTHKDPNSKCDGEDSKQFCQCKHGAADKAGVFPKCFKCAKAAHDGCDKAKYQKCKADGSACECEHGGTEKNNLDKCHECAKTDDCKDNANRKLCDANKCVACLANNTGCVATSATPRCDAGECKGCDNDTFCEKINKDTPVCDTKKGNCKAKAETSDAATVTSTACLVIASVVVALMN